jgi:ketosteroid isomerase-like protein
LRRAVEDWLSTFDALRLDLGDATEVADHVVAPVHAHGRGRASGVSLDTRFCQVWAVRDGSATAMMEYATRERAMSALR